MILFLPLIFTAVSCSSLLSRHRSTVYQSTVSHIGMPQRAVDGNHQQHYNSNSCTHTRLPHTGTVNWWLLDLGQHAHITLIKIWNRRSDIDCCGWRINGARVWIDDAQVSELHGDRHEYHLRPHRTGRYVRITQPKHELTLCEVEVYGTWTGKTGDGPDFFHYPVLVSRNRPTSMSSGSNSQGGVDGIFYGSQNRDGNCPRTNRGSQSWWQVDLQQDYRVTMVALYSRRGKAQEGLQGAKVLVGRALCGVFPPGRRDMFVVTCVGEGVVGSTVRVVRENHFLEFCEAEVFGVKAKEEEDEEEGDFSSGSEDEGEDELPWRMKNDEDGDVLPQENDSKLP